MDANTAAAIGALEAVSTDAGVFAPFALKGIALRAIEEIRRLAAAKASAEAERDAVRAANNALLAFWHEVREHEGQCTENDFWDWSLNLGLMRIEPYDPAKHGENDCDLEPGDDWHMCTDITKRRALSNPE